MAVVTVPLVVLTHFGRIHEYFRNHLSCFRSEQRHGIRYPTMLGDGDSTAHAAVVAAQPYGPGRVVQKMECINHVHKRFGRGLRALAQEHNLGGRGQGRLTGDKIVRLESYFSSAVRNNNHSEEEMRSAIWATLLHCLSTDASPHHTRCPDGPDTWCFFKKAVARRQAPGPHAQHLGTALSHDVARELVPLYQRFSSSHLLQVLLLDEFKI